MSPMSPIDQPLGPPVTAADALRPEPVVLGGRFGRLEKLEAERHGADLWDATAGHDRLWTYLTYGPFADAPAFARWLAERAALADPFAFAVIDRSGRAVGMTALREIRPQMRVVEIGHVLFGPALQGTPLGTEAHYLLMRHLFEALGYRRCEWRCNTLNAASNRAAQRLGFTFEGVFRQHMIVKGRSRDTAWYAMLESEWPALRRAFECWLSPDNFAADGRQRVRLSELRAAAPSGPEAAP